MTAFAYQHPTRCRKCQSTRRTAYESRSEEKCTTTLSDGLPVTHIVRSRCRCVDCGQQRIDTVFHNIPEGQTLDRSTEATPYTPATREKMQEALQAQPETLAVKPTKAKRGIGSKT